MTGTSIAKKFCNTEKHAAPLVCTNAHTMENSIQIPLQAQSKAIQHMIDLGAYFGRVNGLNVHLRTDKDLNPVGFCIGKGSGNYFSYDMDGNPIKVLASSIVVFNMPFIGQVQHIGTHQFIA